MEEKDLLKLLSEFDSSKIDEVSKFLSSPHSVVYHQYVLNLLSNAVSIKLTKVIARLLDGGLVINSDGTIVLSAEGRGIIKDVESTPLSVDKKQFLNLEEIARQTLKLRNLIEEKKVESEKRVENEKKNEKNAMSGKSEKNEKNKRNERKMPEGKRDEYDHLGEDGAPQPKGKSDGSLEGLF